MMLENELEDNPFLLLDIPCSQFQKWEEIIDYNIPMDVVLRIQQLNSLVGYEAYKLQKIQSAEGPMVNMDFFPVTISEFPINPVTGQPFTPQSFFELMRKSLNGFLEGGPASFGGYNTAEMNKWISSNYLTSLMRFDIQVNDWMTQDGSVICVEQHPQRWKFATMFTPQDWAHPVSGVREFGYYQDANGNYVYYTRGVDRVEKKIEEDIGGFFNLESAFEGADVLWNAFQENMAGFVNDLDGQAQINTDYITRPEWQQVHSVIYNNASISSLPGFNNPCN